MLRNNGLIKENIRLKEEIERKNTYIKKIEKEKEKYWNWYTTVSREMLERQVQELKEISKKVEEI